MEKHARAYEDIKNVECLEVQWSGRNGNHAEFQEHEMQIQENFIRYNIKIRCFCDEQYIEIKSSRPVKFDLLYFWIVRIRRYIYLFDGAFYVLEKCSMNKEDITDIIRLAEVGYFQSAKYKHKIPLRMDDRTFKRYFLKWKLLDKKLGIINQMELYASNIKGLPADVRISMLIECYEAFANWLEKQGLINVMAKSKNTQNLSTHRKRGRNTLKDCLMALLETYGKPLFLKEYRRRRSLVTRFVKTRNKVFHVNKKNKALTGAYSGFYAVKLDWLYRYIVWLQLGIDPKELDGVIMEEVTKFEEAFPQLIYGSK